MKMFETHNHLSDFSAFLCVAWTGSQPKRAALKRQPCIDQHSQEHLQDPWVRLSDSPPDEIPEIHHHHCRLAADRTQPINVHSKTATMSDEENTPELNGTAIDLTSDPPSDMPPENPSETCPGAKKGPPVAPKPTWFRQSLRKIRDGQDQKKQTKPAEQRPAMGFNRSFGVRSASSAANLSIKQKIHSFETFSSSEVGPEKGGYRKPVAPSTSPPLMEKESSSHPASHGENEKGTDEIPKEIQTNQSVSVSETVNTAVSATPSAIISSTSEACSQTTSRSSEDKPPSIQSPTDIPLSDSISTDLLSGIQDSHSASVHDDRDVLPSKQESELERVDLSRSTESKVLPPATSMRSSQADGECPPKGTEGDGAQSQEQLLSVITSAAPPADSHPLRGLEGESLEKILAFSNQVICHTMVMFFICHVNII